MKISALIIGIVLTLSLFILFIIDDNQKNNNSNNKSNNKSNNVKTDNISQGDNIVFNFIEALNNKETACIYLDKALIKQYANNADEVKLSAVNPDLVSDDDKCNAFLGVYNSYVESSHMPKLLKSEVIETKLVKEHKNNIKEYKIKIKHTYQNNQDNNSVSKDIVNKDTNIFLIKENNNYKIANTHNLLNFEMKDTLNNINDFIIYRENLTSQLGKSYQKEINLSRDKNSSLNNVIKSDINCKGKENKIKDRNNDFKYAQSLDTVDLATEGLDTEALDIDFKSAKLYTSNELCLVILLAKKDINLNNIKIDLSLSENNSYNKLNLFTEAEDNQFKTLFLNLTDSKEYNGYIKPKIYQYNNKIILKFKSKDIKEYFNLKKPFAWNLALIQDYNNETYLDETDYEYITKDVHTYQNHK